VARDGAFEAETTDQEAPRRGLKEEGDDAGGGVEETEEAEEGLALPEVGDGFRLEDVVDKGASTAAQVTESAKSRSKGARRISFHPLTHVPHRALAGGAASDHRRTDRRHAGGKPQREEQLPSGIAPRCVPRRPHPQGRRRQRPRQRAPSAALPSEGRSVR
jgi:hypothetical protein